VWYQKVGWKSRLKDCYCAASCRSSHQANRKEPIACDFKSYKDRNRIERMFNRLKQFRRVATRYDKTSKSFKAFLNLAAAKLWLPTFVNRA
jgi:transposase